MKRITTVLLFAVGLIIVGCAKELQTTSTSPTPNPSGASTTGTTTTTNRGSTTIRPGGSNQDADWLSPDTSLAWLKKNGYTVVRNSQGGYSIRRNDKPNATEYVLPGPSAMVGGRAIGAIISIDENGELRVAPNP